MLPPASVVLLASAPLMIGAAAIADHVLNGVKENPTTSTMS
jgi:hypothetical protein